MFYLSNRCIPCITTTTTLLSENTEPNTISAYREEVLYRSVSHKKKINNNCAHTHTRRGSSILHHIQYIIRHILPAAAARTDSSS